MVNVLEEGEERATISHFMLRNKRYQTCVREEKERGGGEGAREEGREGYHRLLALRSETC